mmetsp:Transcript_4841/g.11798  ORF Transcript_4841/g.11798 Transcript_4841/m.11798 type:complete len:172 (+) Transcript_4841:110-625(+)
MNSPSLTLSIQIHKQTRLSLSLSLYSAGDIRSKKHPIRPSMNKIQRQIVFKTSELEIALSMNVSVAGHEIRVLSYAWFRIFGRRDNRIIIFIAAALNIIHDVRVTLQNAGYFSISQEPSRPCLELGLVSFHFVSFRFVSFCGCCCFRRKLIETTMLPNYEVRRNYYVQVFV